MSQTIQMRRDTAARWTSQNPVLHDGEWGFEHDTGKVKIGDGTTAWTSLAYTTGGTGIPNGGTTGQILAKNSGTSGDAGWVDPTATANIATTTHAATSKTTPAGSDEIPIADSASSFSLKKYTWTNILAAIQTAVNSAGVAKLTTARTINGVSFDGTANIAPRLDQIAAPTASVALNSQKLTNVLDPTGAQDGATKFYVDDGLADKLDTTGVLDGVTSVLPQSTIQVVYNAGWTLPTGLGTNPLVGFHFLGGDEAHPPPAVSGSGFWSRVAP